MTTNPVLTAHPEKKMKRVDNLHILPTMLKGFVQRAITSFHEFRYEFIKNCFTEFRRFSSPNVKNIDLSDIKHIDDVYITGGTYQDSARARFRLFCFVRFGSSPAL